MWVRTRKTNLRNVHRKPLQMFSFAKSFSRSIRWITPLSQEVLHPTAPLDVAGQIRFKRFANKRKLSSRFFGLM